MNHRLSLVCLSLVAASACLPERFRPASDSGDAEARDDVALADRTVIEAAIDVAVMDDVAAPDARPDALSDATVESGADATVESGADATPDAARDAAPDVIVDSGVCALACTANAACVASACVARNCQGVKEIALARGDSWSERSATIDPDGAGPETAINVFCANDGAGEPREYLDVSSATNHAETPDLNPGCGLWRTNWSRVRLLIEQRGASTTYAIDSSDFRFTTDTVDAGCRSGTWYQGNRIANPNSPFHRMYGVGNACEYRSLRQFFRADLRGTGFRFPPDRVSRYKIANFSSGQANSFVFSEGAYGYRVSVDATCGGIVPIEWDTGGPGEPAPPAGLSVPPEQSSTWRIPILRAQTPSADPAPGSACATPIPAAPIGSDRRRSGVFQSFFSAISGPAPDGAGCNPDPGVTRALWISVEVPAGEQRRFVSESPLSHTTVIRRVESCSNVCADRSGPSGDGIGQPFVMLDNRMGATPRTFMLAVSPRNSASFTVPNLFATFVVQPVLDASCHLVTNANAATTLGAPTMIAPAAGAVASRTVTVEWSLGRCATGAYVEHCRDRFCNSSYCMDRGMPIPCTTHIPAMSPRFDLHFREPGRYFLRMRSLRFWIPAYLPPTESIYNDEPLSVYTDPVEIVVP